MVFAELPEFTKRAARLLDDDSLHRLQLRLMADPEAGQLIRNSGGLRKLRVALPSRGKSGGARVIYVWYRRTSVTYLLTIYAKNEQENVSDAELRELRRQLPP